ncbi:hypothetical protein KR222_003234, partial [Zaprionus bogoriensis]
QEYHYPRPQIPFHLTPQQHHHPQPQPQPQQHATRYIVQTLGPHGRTYELQTHKAPMIYSAHQTYSVQNQQLQQHSHQLQHLYTSVLQNPLLVNTNYQQQQQQLPQLQPVGPPVNYYGQPQAPPTAPATVSVQPQALGQSAASYYRQPQALTADTTAQAHFGQLQQQQQLQEQPHQPHFSNPQPYAIVTLPSGQRVLDAGHGSGPPPADSSQAGGVAQRVGDFAAQSQSATLDTYDYKQAVPGDTRSYQRYVTNCQPNGQCQKLILSPGQIDASHQQVLQQARVRTQPAASCKKSVYVPPGAELNTQGQLRPRGRRTNVHVQEQLAKYPYN